MLTTQGNLTRPSAVSTDRAMRVGLFAKSIRAFWLMRLTPVALGSRSLPPPGLLSVFLEDVL